jgi:cell division protein FtsQ
MKVLVKILFLIPVLYLFAVPVYYAVSCSSVTCGSIEINIVDSSDYHFVTKKHLLDLTYGRNGEIIGKPLSLVPVGDIEKRINVLRELRSAEVYTTIDGTLHLHVDQRNPVMRIIPDEGGDYFLDEEGFIFRKRNLYNPRLHIVGGSINITSGMLGGLSIFDTAISNTILRDVYHFVNYIKKDDFWSAQIDQVYIDGRNRVSLVPRAGSHVINLGTFENYEGKLRNLSAFYEKVLSEVGWDRYSSINLEYRDQVVCRRR